MVSAVFLCFHLLTTLVLLEEMGLFVWRLSEREAWCSNDGPGSVASSLHCSLALHLAAGAAQVGPGLPRCAGEACILSQLSQGAGACLTQACGDWAVGQHTHAGRAAGSHCLQLSRCGSCVTLLCCDGGEWLADSVACRDLQGTGALGQDFKRQEENLGLTATPGKADNLFQEYCAPGTLCLPAAALSISHHSPPSFLIQILHC